MRGYTIIEVKFSPCPALFDSGAVQRRSIWLNMPVLANVQRHWICQFFLVFVAAIFPNGCPRSAVVQCVHVGGKWGGEATTKK